MSGQDLFWNILLFLTLWIISIVSCRNWCKCKQNLGKEKNLSCKLGQRLKNSYIYLIFIERALLRPSSAIPYLFLLFPTLIMILLYLFQVMNPTYKLNNMSIETGYVKKLNIEQDRADSLLLLKESGETEKYYLGFNKKRQGVLGNSRTKIKVWYQNILGVIPYRYVKAIEIDNKILWEDKLEADIYEASVKLWFWIAIAFFLLFWVWYLNKKELSIHRLNRMKRVIYYGDENKKFLKV